MARVKPLSQRQTLGYLHTANNEMKRNGSRLMARVKPLSQRRTLGYLHTANYTPMRGALQQLACLAQGHTRAGA